MRKTLSRLGAGSALLTLTISMTGVALYEQRIVDAVIYMTTTMLALAVAFSATKYP
jgi:hypothetical protein